MPYLAHCKVFLNRHLPRRIRKILRGRAGMALMMVLSSIALLSFIVGEATFTVQLNQKLAYDRLDYLRAQSLAKSGLKLALLRIKAYTEIKKQISKIAESSGADAKTVNGAVPKEILEKIWSEPVTIPFSGDLSGMPGPIKDALEKFRKGSNMTGKMYVRIESQSSRYNLNASTPLLSRSPPSATPTPKNGGGNPDDPKPTPTPTPDPGAPAKEPVIFDPESARTALKEQVAKVIKDKMETDEVFKEKYRNLNPDTISTEILEWADIRMDTQARKVSEIPFKIAPFYHVSELYYLPSMDDELYELISPLFYSGLMMGVNVNTVTDEVLKFLIPTATEVERKAFFTHRDGEQNSGTNFKTVDDFYKYLTENIATFKSSKTKLDEWKEENIKRGVDLTVDELYFIIHIEATVEQAKQTLEAWVSVVDPPKSKNKNPAIDPNAELNANGQLVPGSSATQKPSNLRITLLRFL